MNLILTDYYQQLSVTLESCYVLSLVNIWIGRDLHSWVVPCLFPSFFWCYWFLRLHVGMFQEVSESKFRAWAAISKKNRFSGREERARRALQWLRGKKADVEPELKGIVKSHCEAERHASQNAIFDLLKKKNLKPLMISLGLMFFQQLSGNFTTLKNTSRVYIKTLIFRYQRGHLLHRLDFQGRRIHDWRELVYNYCWCRELHCNLHRDYSNRSTRQKNVALHFWCGDDHHTHDPWHLLLLQKQRQRHIKHRLATVGSFRHLCTRIFARFWTDSLGEFQFVVFVSLNNLTDWSFCLRS